jgi:hypothetical protein
VSSDDAAIRDDAVEVIAGFDDHYGGAEVVVVRRESGGPWFFAGSDAVADPALVARLAGRPTPATLDVKTRRGAVASWLNRNTGRYASPLHLSDEQARQVGEVFANAISPDEDDRA